MLKSYKDTPHGPRWETRTPGLMVPKRFSAFFIVVYSNLSSFLLQPSYFLAILFPLFPCIPALSVVLHVVREPFLTRCSKTAVAWLEGLSFMFRFGLLYLCRGREARGFSSQAYQFLTRLIKEIFSSQGVTGQN